MLPNIKKPSGIRKSTQVAFGGIDLRPEAADGTFSKTINMTSDKLPVMASRPKRRAVYTQGQCIIVNMLGMGDGVFLAVDGALYYNGILIGWAWVQGEEHAVLFGNKIILPQSREEIDLTVIPKGSKSGQAALPGSASDGDAWLLPNQSGNNNDPEELWVRQSGEWINTGPIVKSLEASATISSLQAEFMCGTYQGEDAAWNTIRCWDSDVKLEDLFKPGDAVTITGCKNQPWNNQTLVIREINRNELRFYENSFKQAYLGKRLLYPEDFTYENAQWFRAFGDELPEDDRQYFQIDSTIKSHATSDVDAPDLALYFRPGIWNTDTSGNMIVAFYHWNQQNDAYVYYGSALCYDPTDPQCPISGDIKDLEFEPLEKHPLSTNPAHGADEHYYEDSIKISREWPENLQGVFADSNRLWGWCGHQIRCSKLGDPSNWEFFDGTAEDAWAVDAHDPDAFTGGISIHGYPTFFTENKRYRVYGSEPEAFQLGEQDCNGVRAGCGKSIAAFDGALYYVSRVGVMQDTGGAPVCVSEALGLLRLKDAVAGGHQKRYYVTGKDEAGTLHNLILDTRNGIWIDEGSRDVVSYAAAAGVMHEAELTGTYNDDLTIWARSLGSPLGNGTEEGALSSELVTNDYTMNYANRKRVHRVQLRFVLGSGAGLAVAIQYDGDGTWVPVKSITGEGGKRSVYLPVIPRRCDHFRLRFSADGEWELHSLALDLKQGSAMF